MASLCFWTDPLATVKEPTHNVIFAIEKARLHFAAWLLCFGAFCHEGSAVIFEPFSGDPIVREDPLYVGPESFGMVHVVEMC